MKNIHRLISAFLVTAAFFTPISTFAIAVSWDRPSAGRVNPINILDTVFANIFTATSTTASSTLPKLTSTITNATTICIAGDCKTAWPAGTVTAVTATWPVLSSGGTTPVISWAGLATTSQPASSNLLVSNGTTGIYGVATSSETCTAPLVCAAHAVLTGGGAITWTGLATTTSLSSSNVLVSNGLSGVYSVATTSLGVTGPITFSGTLGAQLGGGGGSFGCATCTLTSRALTIAGTTNQITSSAGSQDLSADRTWTLSLPSLVIVTSASTTRTSTLCPCYFGQSATSSFSNAGALTLTTALTYDSGGTGQSTWTKGDLLYASAANTLSKLAIGTGGFILSSQNGAPSWIATSTNFVTSILQNGGGTAQAGAITLATTSNTTNGITSKLMITNSSGTFTFGSDQTGTLAMGGGGTGQTSFTSSNLLYGAGSGALQSVATSTTGTASTVAFLDANQHIVIPHASTTDMTFTSFLVGTRSGVTGALSPIHPISLGVPTSTTWTASTTGSGYSPWVAAPFAGTLQSAQCIPLVGSSAGSFLGVNTVVNGSNATPSYFVASSTVGTITFSSGNTFTKGQILLLNFGTTTTATATSISCTLLITETP